MYEELEHSFFRIADNLLTEMEDDEFLDWLYCEECTIDDYKILISVLEKEELYEKINVTMEYLNNLMR